MRKILFVNFGHHNLTPVSVPENVYLRKLVVKISLRDPSDGDEVYQKAKEAVESIEEQLNHALVDEEEIIVALPGASMIATAVVAAVSAILNFNPVVVTGTKTKQGYIYSLEKDRLVDLEDLWNDIRGS